MSDWQPISTAPKDGTQAILVSDGHEIRVAWWMHDTDWYRHRGWVYYADSWEDADDNMQWIVGGCEPTHWMPLPPPPQETGAKMVREDHHQHGPDAIWLLIQAYKQELKGRGNAE